MTLLQLISTYGLIGIINLAIIDYMVTKTSESVGDVEPLTNPQRLIVFLFFPIFATLFWCVVAYNLLKR